MKKDRTATIGQRERAWRRNATAVPTGRRWWGRGEPLSTLQDTERNEPQDAFEDLGNRDFEEEIVDLVVGDADDSAALAHWKERLRRYVEQQGPLDALRLRSSTEPPWPARDNPMVGYLIDRGMEIANDEGLDPAVAWLAANAWFEGVIAERARIARLIDED